MFIRNVAICMLALMGVGTSVGCASLRQILTDEGPSFTRTATSISMHLWLKKTGVAKERATEYRTYILEGRALLSQGQVPAETLDKVAALLNEKIDNDVVRAVIQQGIEMVKTKVVLPSTGLLPESAKVWVFAVLDGAVDGINQHLAEADLPQGAPSAQPGLSVISFR
jgi:hypothetical protein